MCKAQVRAPASYFQESSMTRYFALRRLFRFLLDREDKSRTSTGKLSKNTTSGRDTMNQSYVTPGCYNHRPPQLARRRSYQTWVRVFSLVIIRSYIQRAALSLLLSRYSALAYSWTRSTRCCKGTNSDACTLRSRYNCSRLISYLSISNVSSGSRQRSVFTW